ncbi:hypothetical protein HYPSUDRAFT_72104 [Hypholoma sublateritium FD-334 SS-4]|uniref:DUF6534 domain-containing protein n=1 Tax=Hypholoma sublateritium (strain FD-334 SS-4) TaxID=945553 RepID=A0A0D2N892_HYPSF|nr:hypothetical protein HYPSUDRAFT_72104 [Hypholoma sublateritium FD-334 SS-4]
MASLGLSLNFEQTFGALLIGALLTMAIYGITTLQTYFYFLSFPKDGRRTKLLIGGFTNPSLLINGNWSLFASIAMNVALAFLVQAFFTHRIFLLCEGPKRYWITGIISIFVLAHFGRFEKKQFVLLKEVSLTSVVPFGITTVISDILIAAALCVLLASNRSSFADTNSVINKLIIFAVNRCILTCAAAIAETIVFSVLPNSFYTLALDFVIGKLYANSLLAVLNARADLRPNARNDSSTELSTSFNVTPAILNHHASLIQVRTRQSSRNHGNNDFEKGDGVEHIMQSPPTFTSTRSSAVDVGEGP